MSSCNTKHGTDADPFASTKKKQSRPMGIMCFICGREYFSKSIDIHLQQCKIKWQRDEDLKPKKERRKMPQAPKNFDDIIAGNITEGTKDAYNEDAFKEYNEKALVPCDICGRTFLPESLVRHAKGCKGPKGAAKGAAAKAGATKKSPTRASPGKEEEKNEHIPAKFKVDKPKPKPKAKGPAVGPAGITCYICGRKYGTRSIDIHVKQCRDLWEKTEANKPKKERRQCPDEPKTFEEMKINPMGSKATDDYNDEAFKNYNEKALVP
jgi:hypothetical protein